MPDTAQDKDQEKGDEVLRRLLKTPPDDRAGRGSVKGERAGGRKSAAATSGHSVGETKD